jgi:hypothetical protein
MNSIDAVSAFDSRRVLSRWNRISAIGLLLVL